MNGSSERHKKCRSTAIPLLLRWDVTPSQLCFTPKFYQLAVAVTGQHMYTCMLDIPMIYCPVPGYSRLKVKGFLDLCSARQVNVKIRGQKHKQRASLRS